MVVDYLDDDELETTLSFTVMRYLPNQMDASLGSAKGVLPVRIQRGKQYETWLQLDGSDQPVPLDNWRAALKRPSHDGPMLHLQARPNGMDGQGGSCGCCGGGLS